MHCCIFTFLFVFSMKSFFLSQIYPSVLKNLKLIMRTAVLVCVVATASSIWGGCNGDNEDKGGSKKSSSPSAAGGLMTKQKGTVPTKPKPLGGGGIQNAGDGSPPALAPKEPSNMEKLGSIHNKCLRSLESLEDIKDLEKEFVNDKEIEIVQKFRKCAVEMWKLVDEDESVSFLFSTAFSALRSEMDKKIGSLYGRFGGNVDQKSFQDLLNRGITLALSLFGKEFGLFLFKPVLAVSKDTLIQKLAEKETAELLFKLFGIGRVLENRKEATLKKIDSLRSTLDKELGKQFEQLRKIRWVRYHLILIVWIATGGCPKSGWDSLLFRQKRTLLFSTAKFVRQALLEIERNHQLPASSRELGNFFFDLTDFDFILQLKKAFDEPGKADDDSGSIKKDKNLEAVETGFYTKFLERFIISYTFSSMEDLRPLLEKIVIEGKKELGKTSVNQQDKLIVEAHFDGVFECVK